MTLLRFHSGMIFLDFQKKAKPAYIAIKKHNKRTKTHHGSKRTLSVLNIISVPRAPCAPLEEATLL